MYNVAVELHDMLMYYCTHHRRKEPILILGINKKKKPTVILSRNISRKCFTEHENVPNIQFINAFLTINDL